MAKKLVKNYVFEPGLGISDNARPNAVSLIQQNRIFIIKEIVAYIQNQVDAGNPDYSGYTVDNTKCERDAGYVIDALLFDLRYNGNEEIRRISGFYWEDNVPQISGSRVPEIEAYTFAISLINNNILANAVDLTPEQTDAVQIVDLTKTRESGTEARVTELLTYVVDVIQNGLSSLPALDVGLGRIEILGKYGLEDILIITNVTDNIVIYNFAEPTKGGQVRFNVGNSEAYPQAESVNNGTTIINFNYNTSAMNSSDEIQVFLEESELRVRMNDIALDAMERIKVGIPQAMLDADFEYGLQPTKWQAISTLRGYPSTYEIPASEIPVRTVTTDGSLGTGGVGSSLITVTTNGPHGLTAGFPITIKALSSSILGFNRAEGTFLVQSVTSATTFTYYAKSKVGTNGQLLATSNTQLRKADFYTGAEVANPTFTVASQGGAGTITTTLRAPSGATALSFSGTAPPLGVPLSGTGISTGTQITGANGSSNVSGVVTTEYVQFNFTSGGTSLTLSDVSSITAGMMLNSQDGQDTQTVITSVSGNTLTLNRAISTNYRGDREILIGKVLSSTNYIVGTGTGATFNVTASDPGSGLAYTSVTIANAGSGYNQGDTLVILGAAVGGTNGVNDIYLNVDSVSTGAVASVRIISSTTPAGAGTFNGVSSSQSSNPFVTNATIDAIRDQGNYNAFVTSNSGSGIYIGNRFLIRGDLLSGATPANDAIITVTAESAGGSGGVSNYSITGTAIRGEQVDVYAGASISQPLTGAIAAGSSISYTAIATIQVLFPERHGIVPGTTILAAINSGGTNHNLAAGPFFVTRVVNPTTIQYLARSPGTVDTSTEDLQGNIYIRPDSFFTHRPFDGGVQLGTGGPQHGSQAIRQSKKYIRYQSGKGAMYNTGALFAPSFDIGTVTASGTAIGSIITVSTDDVDHGLQSGAVIRISGVETTGYDDTYTVNEIIDERTFTVVAKRPLSATTAVIGAQCQMALVNWHGAIVRSGPYDDQNGIFWQYDGNQLSVGRRSSTFQIAGSISIAANSSKVNGTSTRFLDQLKEGDRIVIRGMTHVVTSIVNNTEMYVSPTFRGIENVSGVKAAKIEDLIIPQSEWNLDRCDGTGPSGYEIDVTKMQMIGVQFTWYGAGFIDWMLRGPDGNYIFCHRLKGNNLNTEAYMRTGNTPVRYEVLNEGANSRLAQAIDATQTTITLADASDFPQGGTVYIDNELIAYTGKSGNTLTGCTRGSTLQNFAGGSLRTYQAGNADTHNSRQGVVLVSSTTSPIISHWGSAYLIDGQFDSDRGYIFNYAETNLTVDTIKQTAFMIRLAPSVSNAIVGDLGTRELLNRAQLLLQTIEITSDGVDGSNNPIVGGIVVEGVLNPVNYPVNPSDVTWSGLSSLAQGGQPSFAQVASGGAISWDSGGTQTDVDITWQGNMTVSGINNSYQTDARGSARDNYVWVLDSVISSTGLRVGSVCQTIPFNGAVVTSIGPIDATFGDRRVNFDRTATNTNTVYSAGSLSLQFNFATARTRSTTAFFTKASWESSAASTGTSVSGSDTNWPPGTIINSVVGPLNFGTTEYYEVTFNNPSTATLSGTGPSVVTVAIGQPPYAQPGETVFSLIAQAGELASLDLSALKELTTTTLGGRGAFPNGPDVLAINVYKVGGANTTANIMLRWGEAQA